MIDLTGFENLSGLLFHPAHDVFSQLAQKSAAQSASHWILLGRPYFFSGNTISSSLETSSGMTSGITRPPLTSAASGLNS